MKSWWHPATCTCAACEPVEDHEKLEAFLFFALLFVMALGDALFVAWVLRR